MPFHRKAFMQFLGSLVICAATSFSASAQDYPTRPIRILVGFAAGSATDTVARMYADKLSQLLQTPVIVDNKPGASNLAAIRALQLAPADGYTLFITGASALAQGPGARKDLPYDPLKDFSLIGFLAISPGVISVAPSLPVHSIQELVAYSAAQPGGLSYASAGVGSAGHLEGEYFRQLTGANMVHVPYKSDSEAMKELAAGTVQVTVTTAQFVIPLAQARKVRPLVVTASRRLPELPDVPTVAETNVRELEGIVPYTYFGLVGPAGMPQAITTRLNEAVNRITAMPDVAARLRDRLTMEPAPATTPVTFRSFLVKEIAKWREVGKTLKLGD